MEPTKSEIFEEPVHRKKVESPVCEECGSPCDEIICGKCRERRFLKVHRLLKESPEKSNRRIAKESGVSHPTVEKVRRMLEEKGDVETFPRRIDTKGRKNPRRKPWSRDRKSRAHVVARIIKGRVRTADALIRRAEARGREWDTVDWDALQGKDLTFGDRLDRLEEQVGKTRTPGEEAASVREGMDRAADAYLNVAIPRSLYDELERMAPKLPPFRGVEGLVVSLLRESLHRLTVMKLILSRA